MHGVNAFSFIFTIDLAWVGKGRRNGRMWPEGWSDLKHAPGFVCKGSMCEPFRLGYIPSAHLGNYDVVHLYRRWRTHQRPTSLQGRIRKKIPEVLSGMAAQWKIQKDVPWKWTPEWFSFCIDWSQSWRYSWKYSFCLLHCHVCHTNDPTNDLVVD